MTFRLGMASLLSALWLAAPSMAVAAAPLHLGSQDVYLEDRTEITVPILLTNFDLKTLNRVDFTLNYPAAALAHPPSIDGDSPVGWTVEVLSGSAGQVRISARDTAGGMKAAWLHLANLRFTVTDASQADSMRFSSIAINGQAVTGAGATTAFRLVNAAKPSKGDINEDGHIDITDVQAALEGMANSAISSWQLDFNGNNQADMHDVGLLHRYVVGLHPNLLEGGTGSGANPNSNPDFTLGAPKPLGQNLYSYVITGKNLTGSISGMITLQVNTNVIARVIPARFSQVGIISKEESVDNRRRIWMSSPDAIDSDSLSFMEIIAEHKPGKSGAGISIPSNFSINIFSTPFLPLGTAGYTFGFEWNYGVVVPVRPPGFDSGFNNRESFREWLQAKGPLREAYRIDLHDSQGRFLRSLSPNGFLVETDLPPGKYLVRITGPERRNFLLRLP